MARFSGDHPALNKLRDLAASFPETEEVEAWEHPTFRVRGKIFASFGAHEGRASIGCKQTRPDQALLLENDGIFFPKYVGKHGWIGMWTDDVSWPLVEELVERSYRLVAMKRQVKLLDEAQGSLPEPAQTRKPGRTPRKHA